MTKILLTIVVTMLVSCVIMNAAAKKALKEHGIDPEVLFLW